MKKLFLIVTLAFLGIFTANAQVWIGGSADAAINKDVQKFSIAPEIGYCIPNTKWTVAIGYKTIYENDSNNTLVSEDWDHFFSPYIRYSICNIEKFGLFMDLTADFGMSNTNFHADRRGYRIGLQPGIAWMATKHWTAAFRFAFIGYNHCAYFGDEGFNLSFATAAPGFGLYYNF